jgi:uncharacterized protein (TIGR02246 family)
VPFNTPEEVSDAFRAAINAGDVPAALELWIDDAAIVQADGHALRGRAAIAVALQALVEHQIEIDIHIDHLTTAGQVGVAIGTLTMRGTNAQGERFEHHSDSTVVYTRGADDYWRLAIDAPWGFPRP